jgi:hypothetical protein
MKILLIVRLFINFYFHAHCRGCIATAENLTDKSNKHFEVTLILVFLVGIHVAYLLYPFSMSQNWYLIIRSDHSKFDLLLF